MGYSCFCSIVGYVSSCLQWKKEYLYFDDKKLQTRSLNIFQRIFRRALCCCYTDTHLRTLANKLTKETMQTLTHDQKKKILAAFQKGNSPALLLRITQLSKDTATGNDDL